jgi:hypothetical protein
MIGIAFDCGFSANQESAVASGWTPERWRVEYEQDTTMPTLDKLGNISQIIAKKKDQPKGYEKSMQIK